MAIVPEILTPVYEPGPLPTKISFISFESSTCTSVAPAICAPKISYIDKYTIKKNNRSPHRAGVAIKTPLSKGSSKISIPNLL